MVGSFDVSIENAYLKYDFTISRNITIIRGDSATGKTTLVEMIRAYNEQEDSGITIKCEKPLVVVYGKNWQEQIEETSGSIVFLDEISRFTKSKEFAETIKGTDNYYVIVTREKLSILPYSITEIYGIRTNGRYAHLTREYTKNEFFRIYGNMPTLSFKPDVIIAACGAYPKVSSVPGADDERIWAPIDCYGAETKLGANVIVIGGASTGAETAGYLADCGHKVILISRKPTVDYDNVAHGASCFVDYLYSHENIRIITSANTLKIENATDVTIQYDPDKQGRCQMHGPMMPDKDATAVLSDHAVTETLHADTVVFSAGVSPSVDECSRYAGIAAEFYVIGDANIHTNDMWKRFMLPDRAPKVGGDVKHATSTAFAAAMSI